MALTNTDRKIIHNGNNSATVFSYGFPILDAAHLSVIYTDADDAETTLSPSEYSVTGIGSRTGGNVTYAPGGAPIATGTKLTIVRTVPYTQTTVLSNQGGYYPEVVEARLDLLTMMVQQIAEVQSRTIVGSISDPATEQSNYELIQALQADLGDFDKLTTRGDLLTRDASFYKRLPRGNAGQFLGISGADPAWQDLPTIDLATSQVTGVLPRANGGFTPSDITASLGADVPMAATGSYADGPSIAQGASGTWWADGTVTITNATGGDVIAVKLWDGTNVIASTSVMLVSVGGAYRASVSLSGRCASPAGNIRISASPTTRTDGVIAFNASGNSKDSTLSAFRIA